MNNQFLKLFVALLMGLSALGPLAIAQSRDRVSFTTPFEFYVGGRKLPAGTYRVSFSRVSPSLLVIEDAQENPRATVVGISAYSVRPLEEARLIFHRYGETHFLSRIWMPGTGSGSEIMKSKLELELAKGGSEETVTIVEKSRRALESR